jgi:aminomethyltransferase
MTLTTPLIDAHKRAHGRFIEFAGWRLPVHYGSILAEARAVRDKAGMFDVSHMGRLEVTGAGALDLLQRLGTNDLSKVKPGKAQYTLWCTADGGVIDDLIVLWLDDGEFLVVVNSSRRADDVSHITAEARGVPIVDVTLDTALIAVQGPQAVAMVHELADADLGLPRFGAGRARVADVECVLSRTGYTGEDGFEIKCAAAGATRLWDALLGEGVVPCGLGARDALRMEMGYPLYGHELGLDISPLEAGVAFAVALGKKEFIGRDAIAKVAQDGPERTLAGFICGRPCVPAPGDELRGDGISGEVTSGGTSVVLASPIGLAFVRGQLPAKATIENRGREIPVDVRPLPLIERSRPKAKSA